MWNSIREDYQELITDIQKSIDKQLKLWAETGDENHKLFADHQIRHLNEVKTHVKRLEDKARKY